MKTNGAAEVRTYWGYGWKYLLIGVLK